MNPGQPVGGCGEERIGERGEGVGDAAVGGPGLDIGKVAGHRKACGDTQRGDACDQNREDQNSGGKPTPCEHSQRIADETYCRVRVPL